MSIVNYEKLANQLFGDSSASSPFYDYAAGLVPMGIGPGMLGMYRATNAGNSAIGGAARGALGGMAGGMLGAAPGLLAGSIPLASIGGFLGSGLGTRAATLQDLNRKKLVGEHTMLS